ncbi:MAG: HDIG domain-containing protein [Nitrososphaeria archaeon]|nr:HDIG domain-containing protein [Nitrososphaeria archaeon]
MERREDLTKEIHEIIDMISDEKLREKTREAFFSSKKGLWGIAFEGFEVSEAPASRRRHHSYPQGLLEHTVSTAKIALLLCELLEKLYGGKGKVNKDVVLSGTVLHDYMKVPTYEKSEDGHVIPSRIMERIDHITLAAVDMTQRGFPLEVIHAVTAHFGKHGTIFPKSIEALVVYLADHTDSHLNGDILNSAKSLARRCAEVQLEQLNIRTAIDIVSLYGKTSCKELVEYLKKAELLREDNN